MADTPVDTTAASPASPQIDTSLQDAINPATGRPRIDVTNPNAIDNRKLGEKDIFEPNPTIPLNQKQIFVPPADTQPPFDPQLDSVNEINSTVGQPSNLGSGISALDAIINKDRDEQQHQIDELANRALVQTNDISLDDKINQARKILQANQPVDHTPGDIVASKAYYGAGPDVQKDVAAATDKQVLRETNQKAQLHILGQSPNQTMDGFLKTNVPALANVPGYPKGKETTWDHLVDYMSMAPLDAKAEVDISQSFHKWWGEGGDIQKGWNDLDKQMTARYGKDWKWQAAGWMAKEALIDGAVLMAIGGLPILGAAVFGLNVVTKAGWVTRLAQVGARIAGVSVGAGGIKAGINATTTNRDPNFKYEAFQSGVGQAGGEALNVVGKGVKALYKSRFPDAAIPARVNGPKFDKSVLESTTTLHNQGSSFYSEIRNAAKTSQHVQQHVKQAYAILQGIKGTDNIKPLEAMTDIEKYEMIQSAISGGLIADPNRVVPHLANPLDDVYHLGSNSDNGLLYHVHENPINEVITKEDLANLARRAEVEQSKVPVLGKNGKPKKLQPKPLQLSLKERVELGQDIFARFLGESEDEFAGRLNSTIDMYLNPEELTLGFKADYGGVTGFGVKNSLQRMFFDPKDSFGAIVKEQAMSAAHTEVAMKAFTKAFNGLRADLHKAGKRSGEKAAFSEAMVEKALVTGERMGKVLSQDELETLGLKQHHIDAYYNIKALYDKMFMTIEVHEVNKARAAGLKQLKDKLVKITDHTLDEDGNITVQEVTNTSSKKGKISKVKPAELSEVDKVLDYNPGYKPIQYADKYKYAIHEVDPKNGTVKRIMATRNKLETKDQMDTLQAANPDKVYVQSRWNGTPNTYEAGFHKNSVKLMDSMNDQEFANIAKALEGTGIDAENLRVVSNAQTFGSLKKSITGKRAATRLTDATGQTAEMKPAFEATASYLQNMAKRLGTDDWRNYAIQQWKDFYTSKGVKLPTNFFGEDVKLPSPGTALYDDAYKAQMAQNYLRNVFSGKVAFERKISDWADAFIWKAVQSDSKTYKGMATIMDSEFSRTFLQSARMNTTRINLLFVNLAQALPQLSQGLSIVPSSIARAITRSPVVEAKGWLDVARTFGGMVADVNGARVPNAANAPLIALRKSGFLDDMEMLDIAKNLANGRTNLLMDMLYKGAKAPLVLPDKMLKVIQFNLSRQNMIAQVEKGLWKDVNGVVKDVEIDSREFLSSVVEHAKDYTLDFSGTGKIGLNQSQVGRTAFQYFQYGPKVIRQLYTSGGEAGGVKSMTGVEKIATWSTLIGLFGASGIPFGHDALNFTDWTIYKTEGALGLANADHRQVATEFMQHFGDVMVSAMEKTGMTHAEAKGWVEQGASGKLTDNQYSLASRMVPGAFLSQWLASAERPEQFIPFVGTYERVIKGGGTIIQALDQMYATMNYYEKLRTGQPIDPSEVVDPSYTDAKAAMDVFKGLGQAAPGIGTMYTTYKNLTDLDASPNGEVYGTSLSGQNTGQILTKENRNQYRYMTLLGVKANIQEDIFNQRDTQNTLTQAVKDEMSNWQRKYLNAVNDAAAYTILLQAQSHMAEVESTLRSEGHHEVLDRINPNGKLKSVPLSSQVATQLINAKINKDFFKEPLNQRVRETYNEQSGKQ